MEKHQANQGLRKFGLEIREFSVNVVTKTAQKQLYD